jgi:hypothetical protein
VQIRGPSAPIDREHPVNLWPTNQLAKRWLLQVPNPPPLDRDIPHLVQLLNVGFERDLAVPGCPDRDWWVLEQNAGLLLGRSLDPKDVIYWFFSNPNAGDEQEQRDTLEIALEESQTWEEAAQNVMETYYDRLRAQMSSLRGP